MPKGTPITSEERDKYVAMGYVAISTLEAICVEEMGGPIVYNKNFGSADARRFWTTEEFARAARTLLEIGEGK